MTGKRILICGGRDYGNDRGKDGVARPGAQAERDHFERVMFGLIKNPGIAQLCQGGQTGADRMAFWWALHYGVPIMTYPARWKELGRRAGPARNAQMITAWWPDLVVAFPGDRGTRDMVRRAREASIEVWLEGWNDEQDEGQDP